MKTIVFDLECKLAIVADTATATAEECDLVNQGEAVHGWGNAHKAGISSAVAYAVEEDRYYIYGDTAPEHYCLAQQLMDADRVVGFNHVQFDYKLLATTLDTDINDFLMDSAPGERDWDLLQMIWGGINRRDFAGVYGLDKVSTATLGTLGGKSGHGANAPELYRQGRFGELLDYNLRDVDLTQRLYRFIQQYGFVLNGVNNVIRVKHPTRWY